VETITLAQAVKNVTEIVKGESEIRTLTMSAFDLWFAIAFAICSGTFTVSALETATGTSCKTQVSKMRRIFKAMDKSKKFTSDINANKFSDLNSAYEASAQYVNKAKTSRKQSSKLDRAKTWAMTKTLAELNVLEQAIKAAKIAKRK